MKTYEVNAEVTISITAYVRAASEEEALEKAEGYAMPGFCNGCTRMGMDPDDECWNVGELDGEPRNLTVEES